MFLLRYLWKCTLVMSDNFVYAWSLQRKIWGDFLYDVGKQYVIH
jgi:hypothetical protein